MPVSAKPFRRASIWPQPKVTTLNIWSVSRQPTWSKRMVVPWPSVAGVRPKENSVPAPLGRSADAVPDQLLGAPGPVHP